MQVLDGRMIMSASDLMGFADCAHRSALDREVALGLRAKPVRVDPMGELLGQIGKEHEAGRPAGLEASGTVVASIDPPGTGTAGLVDAQRRTLDAMRSGAAAIYQATLFDPPWRCRVDFLLRVETASDLGEWSYEVADAKLGRTAKERDWLRLAFCSDRLARLQGRLPDQAHILLGDGSQASGHIADRVDRVRQLQAHLLDALGTAADVDPEPNSSCGRCRWQTACQARWRSDGHLSLLGVDARTRTKLAQVGVTTIPAAADLGPDVTVAGVSTDTLRKARSDARLWLHEERSGVPHLRLRYPRQGKGLSLLPSPSDGDLFLDLEGYPFGPDGQLEYLWGIMVAGVGIRSYVNWWAHTPMDEERAFGAVVAFLEAAVIGDPDLHVYHYNTYETSAMRRLAQRVGGEVGDRALRLVDAVFVDLLPIARYSVRTSSMSVGLKSLERFYRPGRAGKVTDAAGSMADYGAWLQHRDPVGLRAIEAYNRADCASLADLRDWLLGLAEDVAEARAEAGEPDPAVAETASIPGLRDRLVVAAGLPAGGVLLRRTLVAMDFDGVFDVGEVAGLLGWGIDDVRTALIRGKKELGIPVSVEELNPPGNGSRNPRRS